MAVRDFSVSNFMARVDALGGPVKKNRFSVEVTPPRSMVSSVTADTINFLAKAVSFPAKTLAATEFRYAGKYQIKVPYETTYENVAITLLNTGQYSPRKFWNNWFNHIQNNNSKNMQYYDKFVGTVTISHYLDDEENIDPTKAAYSVTLHDAWPLTMNAIEMSWENAELMDFQVDLNYSHWTATGENITTSNYTTSQVQNFQRTGRITGL